MRKGLFTKKIIAYVCAATMIFSSFAGVSIANSEQVSAADGINVSIDEFSVKDGQTDTYKGWFAADTKIETSDYKYVEMTYTGTGDAFNETRIVFADATGATLPEVWFATWQSSKFVTVDGTDVPVATEEPQTVVIDLEASGVDTSKGFEGLHIHAGNALTGTVNISSFKFLKEVASEPVQASTIAINDLSTITVADGDKETYRGWFPAATKTTPEYKYLQFTYTGTGDALNETRLQFVDGEGGFSDFYWFANWQSVKFVTVDGTDVPAPTEEPQTVVIDLEASGLDLSKGIEGFHIHAGLTLLGTINFSDVKLQTTPEITKEKVPASTVKINDLSTITVADGDKETYRGWFPAATKTTPEYKYLQFTYTGTGDALNETRLQFVDGEGGFSDFYWFANWQSVKFVTVDGTDVPAPTEEPQTVVIDLEASGLDLSKGIEGFHIHAGLTLLGTINFSDVKLQTTPEITEKEEDTSDSSEQPSETSTPQPTTAADPSTGIQLDDAASGMNKTYHIDKVAADSKDDVKWAYLGFVTFKDLATKDFKYLKFTYTGNIQNFRIEFNHKESNTNQGPFWFDPEQELHFVTADGSAIPMVGDNTTIVIDLEASGVDMSKYNNGLHLHGNSTKDAAFDLTIKDAVLYGGTPTPRETTTSAPKPTTKKVTPPGRTKVKSASKKKSAKKIKISLKKLSKAKGYYVQISKAKKFTKKNILVKKYVKKATFTITSKKLKNKKKLYVRAKAYKLNGKKKVLSKKWSVVKKVKIKK